MSYDVTNLSAMISQFDEVVSQSKMSESPLNFVDFLTYL